MVKKKKVRLPSEEAEQKAIIKWWESKSKDFTPFSHCLLHVPNGTIAARNMAHKGLGVRSGVPDLFLAIPSGGYHGLWIELKRLHGGVVSEEQVEFIQFLKSMHYAAFVCKGHAAAERLIEIYLTEPEELVGRVGELVF